MLTPQPNKRKMALVESRVSQDNAFRLTANFETDEGLLEGSSRLNPGQDETMNTTRSGASMLRITDGQSTGASERKFSGLMKVLAILGIWLAGVVICFGAGVASFNFGQGLVAQLVNFPIYCLAFNFVCE